MAQGNSLHSGPAGVSRSLEAASTLMAVTPGNFLHYLAFPTYITCQCQNWTSLPTGCSCAGNSSWASAPGPQDVLRNGRGRKHCVDIRPVHLARKGRVTKGLAYQLLEFSHCLWIINSSIGYIGYVFFGLQMGICPCSDPRVTPHIVGPLVSAAPHYSLIFLGQPLN